MIVIGPRQVAAKRRRPAERTRIFEDEAIFFPQAGQNLKFSETVCESSVLLGCASLTSGT